MKNEIDFYFIRYDDAQELAKLKLHGENRDKINQILEENLKLEKFPDTVLQCLDVTNIHTYLNHEIANIKDLPKSEKIKVDLRFTNKIQEFIKVDFKIASKAEFWGGLCICDEIICKFINVRFGYINNYDIFFKTHSANGVTNLGDRIRNFCSEEGATNIVRNYLAQIWWISKLVPKNCYKTIWLRQDYVNSFLQRMIGYIDQNGKPTQFVEIIFKFLDIYEKVGKFETNRRQKIRELFKWCLALEKTKPIHLYNKSEMEIQVKNIFNHIFKLFDDGLIKKPELIQEKIKNKTLIKAQQSLKEYLL